MAEAPHWYSDPPAPSFARRAVVVLGVILVAEGMIAAFVASQVIYFHPLAWAAWASAAILCWAGLELTGLMNLSPKIAAVATLGLGIAISVSAYGLLAAESCADQYDCSPVKEAAIYAIPIALGVFNLVGAFVLWRRGSTPS